jgi:hypothetical protein
MILQALEPVKIARSQPGITENTLFDQHTLELCQIKDPGLYICLPVKCLAVGFSGGIIPRATLVWAFAFKLLSALQMAKMKCGSKPCLDACARTFFQTFSAGILLTGLWSLEQAIVVRKTPASHIQFNPCMIAYQMVGRTGFEPVTSTMSR